MHVFHIVLLALTWHGYLDTLSRYSKAGIEHKAVAQVQVSASQRLG